MLNALELYRKYGQQDRAENVQDQQMMDQRQQREFSNNMAMVQMAQQQQARQQAMQQAAQQREQEMGWRRQQMGMNAQLARERMSQAERIARERMGAARAAAEARAANKPQLPASALDLQNKTLEQVSGAESITKDLSAMLEQVRSGKLDLGFVANPVNRIRNQLGASTEASSNLASLESGIEKLRNDSLRLNIGVQTDKDAERALNELIKNINDPRVVGDRLQELITRYTSEKQQKAMQLDLMRRNFGADPIDLTQIERRQPSIGAETPQQGQRSGGWDEQKERRYQEWKKSQGARQ